MGRYQQNWASSANSDVCTANLCAVLGRVACTLERTALICGQFLSLLLCSVLDRNQLTAEIPKDLGNLSQLNDL